MDNGNAYLLMLELLSEMVSAGGSDLFITANFPPAMKIHGKLTPVRDNKLTSEEAMECAVSIMDNNQLHEFKETSECNFAIHPNKIGRFRVNAMVQQGHAALVLRTIETTPPTLDKLNLPDILSEITMAKRGLVIMVGATGSGKSTSLAAMINHRNENSYGHIITIEDPVEFVHPHKNCVISQREVGVDTDSYSIALKNTLRQAPDVILLGEIRDRETMEFGIQFAETGHLAMATLHANNANQALDRIINFFPEAKRDQLLMDLALNLKAIVSQRLIKTIDGKSRVAAIEILLNSPRITDLIMKGKVDEIKEVMSKSCEEGMRTFDQALFSLYEAEMISFDEAMHNADSANELRLQIKLNSNLEFNPAKNDTNSSFSMAHSQNTEKDQGTLNPLENQEKISGLKESRLPSSERVFNKSQNKTND